MVATYDVTVFIDMPLQRS